MRLASLGYRVGLREMELIHSRFDSVFELIQ